MTCESILSAKRLTEAYAAMVATAEAEGADLAFAIVDASGVCCAYLKMPNSFLASETYAFQKAYTAASFRMGTTEFGALLDSMPTDVAEGLLAHPDVTRLSGGVPIFVAEELAGAIGVSGGNAQQDETVAAAGLALFANEAA